MNAGDNFLEKRTAILTAYSRYKEMYWYQAQPTQKSLHNKEVLLGKPLKNNKIQRLTLGNAYHMTYDI